LFLCWHRVGGNCGTEPILGKTRCGLPIRLHHSTGVDEVRGAGAGVIRVSG
jgi:hypothetical protein